MATRDAVIVLVATVSLGTRAASAQPDLPPPPPPPLTEPSDVPSLPPPPEPPSTPSGRPAAPPTQPPAPSAAHGHRRDRALIQARPGPAPEAERVPPARPATTTVTWNPLGVVRGRLSGNLEFLVAAHHALIASPSALVFRADRGGAHDLLAEGFGFTTEPSLSFGAELGYHYWPSGRTSLHGPFVGPSLLLGATTHAAVGDASHAQPYLGVAVDIGAQEVMHGGFTAGAGVGLGLVHMADATALVPRLLGQIGWSF
jgi:hypothetical protein